MTSMTCINNYSEFTVKQRKKGGALWGTFLLGQSPPLPYGSRRLCPTVNLSYKRYGVRRSLDLKLICYCWGCFQHRRSCIDWTKDWIIESLNTITLASKYDRKLSKHASSTLSLLYFVETFYSAHSIVFNRPISYGTDRPSLQRPRSMREETTRLNLLT